MSNKNIRESQQQSQFVAIGTQGNEDQPTPLGNDLHQDQNNTRSERHIPSQDQSLASNLRREGNSEQQTI